MQPIRQAALFGHPSERKRSKLVASLNTVADFGIDDSSPSMCEPVQPSAVHASGPIDQQACFSNAGKALSFEKIARNCSFSRHSFQAPTPCSSMAKWFLFAIFILRGGGTQSLNLRLIASAQLAADYIASDVYIPTGG